ATAPMPLFAAARMGCRPGTIGGQRWQVAEPTFPAAAAMAYTSPLKHDPDAEHHPPAAEPEVHMPGDFLRRSPQLTMEQFHGFRDERPKEEKWELIDGVPIMMPPPTLVHQQIADNLNQLLNMHLREVKPGWRAIREAGVWLKDDERYN